jgi:hypothetical protein
MNRFFFDIVSVQSHQYDFRGRHFLRSDDAVKMAELIAMDLGSSETDDWKGSHVKVRDTAGQTLFSIPIVLAA